MPTLPAEPSPARPPTLAELQTAVGAVLHGAVPSGDSFDGVSTDEALDYAGVLARFVERALAQRDLTDLSAVELQGEWLVERVDRHTCGAGDPPWGHEPSCGLEPVVQLSVALGALSRVFHLEQEVARLASAADRLSRARDLAEPVPGQLTVDDFSPPAFVCSAHPYLHTAAECDATPATALRVTDAQPFPVEGRPDADVVAVTGTDGHGRTVHLTVDRAILDVVVPPGSLSLDPADRRIDELHGPGAAAALDAAIADGTVFGGGQS